MVPAHEGDTRCGASPPRPVRQPSVPSRESRQKGGQRQSRWHQDPSQRLCYFGVADCAPFHQNRAAEIIHLPEIFVTPHDPRAVEVLLRVRVRHLARMLAIANLGRNFVMQPTTKIILAVCSIASVAIGTLPPANAQGFRYDHRLTWDGCPPDGRLGPPIVTIRSLGRVLRTLRRAGRRLLKWILEWMPTTRLLGTRDKAKWRL